MTKSFHASKPCLHVIYGMAHGKKDGFYAPCVWGVGESDIALTHVAHADKSRGALHGLKRLFKAFQARHAGKGKALCGGKLVASNQVLKECRGIPIEI